MMQPDRIDCVSLFLFQGTQLAIGAVGESSASLANPGLNFFKLFPVV
jgi:hypothetical protein